MPPGTLHRLTPGTRRRCPACGNPLRPRRRREPTLEAQGFPFMLPRREPWFALGTRPWIIQVNPHGNPEGPSHQWMESLASRMDGFTEEEAKNRLAALSHGALGLVYRAFNTKTHEVIP